MSPTLSHQDTTAPVRRRHRRRWGAAGLAALALAGACSSVADTSAPEAAGVNEAAVLGFTPDAVQWTDCAGRLQCASLEVPLDYADPEGPTIVLALAMLPATDDKAKIGTLVTNPGGPGGSGVDFLGNDGPFNDVINRRFDIVSWDPRGVGRTQPLDCGDQLAETFLTVDLAPTDAAGSNVLEEAVRADATACGAANGALLRHVGTADAVLDLEAIRLALGGEVITYVGFSYGTLIGLRYAERFPNSLRAMALDGVVDPAQSLSEQLSTTASSIDISLAAALEACDVGCPIAGDPLDAYRAVVEQARREPLRTDDGTTVVANAVVIAGIAVTYDEGLRDLFYSAVAEGQRGLGNIFRLFAEGFVGEFDLAPTFAVYCGDLPHPTSSEAVEELALASAGNATVVPGLASGYVRAFALPCLDWPVAAPSTVTPVTAVGTPPILVIGNTGDPVTPYEAARGVARSLESARLLTYHGARHRTYGSSVCADTYIDAYLLDLVLPPSGADCAG